MAAVARSRKMLLAVGTFAVAGIALAWFFFPAQTESAATRVAQVGTKTATEPSEKIQDVSDRVLAPNVEASRRDSSVVASPEETKGGTLAAPSVEGSAPYPVVPEGTPLITYPGLPEVLESELERKYSELSPSERLSRGTGMVGELNRRLADAWRVSRNDGNYIVLDDDVKPTRYSRGGTSPLGVVMTTRDEGRIYIYLPAEQYRELYEVHSEAHWLVQTGLDGGAAGSYAIVPSFR